MDPAGRPLRVRVNNELVLDAGTCHQVAPGGNAQWRIEPPAPTLFRQVLSYLEAKPDPAGPLSGSEVGREGVATAAVVLRWGSYLAVLADADKPVSPEAGRRGTSRISDDEMARINIEASAALAQWIDLYRQAQGGGGYRQLVERAFCYLPMPQKTSRARFGTLAELSHPHAAQRLARVAPPDLLARVRARAERHPSRLLANTMVNVAWRNGPVEDIHAGRRWAYSLDERRLAAAEERTLMRFSADGMALAMTVCLVLTTEGEGRSWPEQVCPYGLVVSIAPSRWSLTEASREVLLPASRGP